jgi:hypothetical protein
MSRWLPSRLALTAIAVLVLACHSVEEHEGRHGAGGGLSEHEAVVLAAELANDECERWFARRPFAPSDYPIGKVGRRYRWGHMDPAGVDGFSAEVSFDPDGRDVRVKCYLSSDIGFQE